MGIANNKKKLLINSFLVFIGVGVISIIILMASIISSLSPVDTGHLVSNIYTVQENTVNSYYIKTNYGYVAIDAGFMKEDVLEGLNKVGIDPNEVTAVLLTHSDMDHVGGISLFPNAKVFLPRREETMIDGSTTRILGAKNYLETEYSVLEDEQEIIIDGLRIKCISTPGHTLGHMSFQVDDLYLFAGDLLGLKDGKIIPFVKIFDMDQEQSIKSFTKVANLAGCKYVFTGHHGFADNYDMLFKEYR